MRFFGEAQNYFAAVTSAPHFDGPGVQVLRTVVGPIDNNVVTCPWHGWSYEIRTGTMVQDPRVGVSRHEVRLDGDEVSVRLTD